jgi:hypothetical protein
MPFPFHWAGALFAAVFLSIAFVTFGILLKMLNGVATEVRGSILPGLVGGIRDWADGHGRGRPAIAIAPQRADQGGQPFEDAPPNAEPRLEHVRRDR